jgi:hypothetical protein
VASVSAGGGGASFAESFTAAGSAGTSIAAFALDSGAAAFAAGAKLGNGGGTKGPP